MNKVVAVTAGVLLALAPAGTALAGETGSGLAWGNCQNSSAGGVHAPLLPEIGQGNGNGGLQAVAKQSPGACTVAVEPVPDADDLLAELIGTPDEEPVYQY